LGFGDGWHWDPLVAGQGVNGNVREMKSLAGRLFMQGSGSVGPGNIRGTVVWEGGRWQPFNAAGGDSVTFSAELKMFTEHRGRIVAFGKLYEVVPENACQKGEYTWRLAEWDGSWRVLTPSLEFKVGWPLGLVSVGDDVVVLGSFTGPKEEQDRGVVWDGSRWRTIGLDADNSRIRSSAVVRDRLFVAWDVRAEDGPPQFFIAEWDSLNWKTIKSGIHSQVHAMVERDGRLVASFSIPHDECSESSPLQEWDGEEWRPLTGSFSYRYEGDARVQQLVMYQGHLVASGNFKGVGNLACKSVAFWDGELWRPLGGGVTGEAHRLVPTESSLWVGGNFGTAGGDLSLRVARWDGQLPAGTLVESLTEYTPEEKPATRRGDGWHSHILDMTDPPLPFANGDFRAWTEGLPDRWEWRTSSKRQCPVDSVPPIHLPEGGVGIKVGEDKRCYGSLAQRFAVEGGRFYRIRARYEVSETTHESRWPACRMSVGDYQRKPTGYEYGPLHTGMWVGLEGGEDDWAEIILRADSKANVGVVTFSASAPGAELRLREVAVDTLSMPEDAVTRLLIAELRSKYVPQSDRVVDWEALVQQFTGIKSEEQKDYDRVATDLLKALEERRVTLESGQADVTHVMLLTEGEPVPEEDRLTRERMAAIRGQLMDWQTWGGRSALGWTRHGVAYVKLDTPRIGDEQLGELATADGILIDLRASGDRSMSRHGEFEKILGLAGRFAKRRLVYGFSKPSPTGVGVEDTLRVHPSADQYLGMPVVCLIGEGCMGDATEFAMMMKTMPNVTLVGRSTRGGTGGMARFSLPTGSHVNYPSRSLWSSDRELINDSHGLQPDVTIEPDGSLDLVFTLGLQILREKISELQK
jgi:hypothetical protein